MSYLKAKEMALEADVDIIKTFPKLWEDRGWVGKSPIRVIPGIGFIAWAPKELRGREFNKIYYLYIKPKFRGQGYGRKLIGTVPGDVLYVTEQENIPAKDFCKSLGMYYIGTEANEFGGYDDYYTLLVDTTVNNGGPTHYYDLDPSWKGAGDIIEGRGMNFNQGTIFKAAFCFNIGRHKATDYERELNKIIYFAKRELAWLKTSEKKRD